MRKEIVRQCVKLRRKIERKSWRDKEQKKYVLQKYAELVNLLV